MIKEVCIKKVGNGFLVSYGLVWDKQQRVFNTYDVLVAGLKLIF